METPGHPSDPFLLTLRETVAAKPTDEGSHGDVSRLGEGLSDGAIDPSSDPLRGPPSPARGEGTRDGRSALPVMQRARGAGAISIGHDGVTRLARLHQSGSAKVRFCASPDGVREAVLINTAGGMTGGDRFDWRMDLAPGARARAVTQACEKVYRSAGGPARVSVSLTVGAGASLEWLPQETILFEGAELARTFDMQVEPGGRLLAAEAVILGRQAMGERDVTASLSDRWRVQWGERLIFADNLRLDAGPTTTARPAVLRNARAFALVLLVSDEVDGASEAEAHLDAVREAVGEEGGASAWSDGWGASKLVCRIAAADGLALRRRLTAVISVLRAGAAAPRLWTV